MATSRNRPPPALRAKVEPLADESDRSVERVILDPIERPIADRSLWSSLIAEAIAADAEIEGTGEVYRACDVHRWMNAYVGVLDHPYFSVSGPDGSFTITGLPPGTYTIEARHEMFGTRTTTVTVGNVTTTVLTGNLTINNAGTLIGAVDLSGTASSTFNNTSSLSWHTGGTSTFSTGNDTLTNGSSGLIATTGATTFDFGTRQMRRCHPAGFSGAVL